MRKITPAESSRAPLRVSDAEREAAVAELARHAGAGRLAADELAERTEAALRARTRADLDALLADLPPATAGARSRAGLRAHARAYALVIAGLVAIWALTGAGYPWPVWPALGWGIGLAAHASGAGWGSQRQRSSRCISTTGPGRTYARGM